MLHKSRHISLINHRGHHQGWHFRSRITRRSKDETRITCLPLGRRSPLLSRYVAYDEWHSTDSGDQERSLCAAPYRTMPCRAVPCRTAPCSTVQCCVIPCHAVLCCAVCRALPCGSFPCSTCSAVPCRVPCRAASLRAVPTALCSITLAAPVIRGRSSVIIFQLAASERPALFSPAAGEIRPIRADHFSFDGTHSTDRCVFRRQRQVLNFIPEMSAIHQINGHWPAH